MMEYSPMVEPACEKFISKLLHQGKYSTSVYFQDKNTIDSLILLIMKATCSAPLPISSCRKTSVKFLHLHHVSFRIWNPPEIHPSSTLALYLFLRLLVLVEDFPSACADMLICLPCLGLADLRWTLIPGWGGVFLDRLTANGISRRHWMRCLSRRWGWFLSVGTCLTFSPLNFCRCFSAKIGHVPCCNMSDSRSLWHPGFSPL